MTTPAASSPADAGAVLLAVNGTLMRGLELNGNLLAVGARFVREARTAACYRLWSIGDRHPAMIRVTSGGVSVALEIWAVPAAGLATVLLQEPPGLAIGKVALDDGGEVLGVLGEPALCEQHGREITEWGGWRAYLAGRGKEIVSASGAQTGAGREPAGDLGAYVDGAAPLVGLTLTEAQRAGVVHYLGLLRAAAALVLEHPLDDTTESAPGFRP